MLNLDAKAKELKKSGFKTKRNAKPSKVKADGATLVRVSGNVHLLLVAYAKENQIYVQDAVDDLVRKGLHEYYSKGVKKRSRTRDIIKFFRRKGTVDLSDIRRENIVEEKSPEKVLESE